MDVLDDRMTNETKAFVTNSLKTLRPNMIPKIEISLLRSERENNALTLLAKVPFNNLNLRKLTIKSKKDNYEIPVLALVPENASKNSAITIYFHGGGWSLGSYLTHFYTVASLAKSTNIVWLSVDYRLAPEFKFDTQLEDCRSVLEWLFDNRTQFSSASAKIGVSGDSAGGHYSTILTHEYKKKIDYQILIYPCVDMAVSYPSNTEFSSEIYALTPELIEYFVKNFLPQDTQLNSSKMSPLHNDDFTHLPKCLIVAAELDPLIDQVKAYNDKLLKYSNQSELKIIKGTIHGFFHNGYYFQEAFDEAVRHITQFVRHI